MVLDRELATIEALEGRLVHVLSWRLELWLSGNLELGLDDVHVNGPSQVLNQGLSDDLLERLASNDMGQVHVDLAQFNHCLS